MDLRHLRYFVTVAKTGSFTQAAKQLFTVQPSLSRQIKDLEDYIGTDLLIRGPRKVELTPSGQLLYEEAQQLLAQYQGAIQRVQHFANSSKQKLKVGFDYGLEQPFLPRISTLLTELDHTKFDIMSLPAPHLITELTQGQLDLAFIPYNSTVEELECYVLGESELIAIMRENHPLADQTFITPQMLASQSIAIPSQKLGPELHGVCVTYTKLNRLNITFDYEIESLSIATTLINTMDCIGLLPAYVRELLPDQMITKPLSGDIPRIRYCVVWNKAMANSPLMTQLKVRFAELK